MTLLQVRTMKLSLCFRSSLSRFAQASTAVLIALVLAGAARADTIKDFGVSGTAINVSGGSLGSCADGATCPFSGTMMVDVTSSTMFPNGTVTAEGITFPGLPTFDICCTFTGPFGGEVWRADSSNHHGQALQLDFTTGHTPASLVGFDGGSITGDSAFGPVFPEFFYVDLSGSITPIPEPSSLALLGSGVLVFTQVRRHKLM